MLDVKTDLAPLDDLIRRLEGSDDEAAEAVAEAIHADADTRVPQATGALRKSGRVEARGAGEAAVVYGDKSAPYALTVHESPAIQPRTGEKMWLRNSAMEARKLLRVAAATVAKRLK